MSVEDLEVEPKRRAVIRLALVTTAASLVIRLVFALNTSVTLDELLDSPTRGSCGNPFTFPDGFPPLHHVLFVCTGLSSRGLFASRISAVLLVSAAIFIVTASVARTIGINAAWWFGAGMALCPAIIEMGFQARAYALELAGVSLLVAGMLAAQRSKKGYSWTLFVGLVLAGASTYPAIMIATVAVAGAMWMHRSRRRFQLLRWMAPALVLCGLLALFAVTLPPDVRFQSRISDSSSTSVERLVGLTTLTVLTGPALPVNSDELKDLHSVVSYGLLIALLVVSVAAFTSIVWLRRGKDIAVTIIGVGVPVILLGAAFVAIVFGVDLRPRYYYHLAPLAILVAAAAMRAYSPARIAAILIFGVVSFATVLRLFGQGAPPQDLRGAATALNKVAKPSDDIYVVSGFMKIPLDYDMQSGFTTHFGPSSSLDVDSFATWLRSARDNPNSTCSLFVVESKLSTADPNGVLGGIVEQGTLIAKGRGFKVRNLGPCPEGEWSPPDQPQA